MDLAIYRYKTASDYFQSIKMIHSGPDRNTEKNRASTILPKSMLAGFALELYFKAWLLEVGRPPDEVKAYGHQINDLYAEVIKEGLPVVNLLGQLVGALSKGHGRPDFTFRYIEEGSEVANIKWDVVFEIFEKLDKAVDAKIGATAAMKAALLR